MITSGTSFSSRKQPQIQIFFTATSICEVQCIIYYSGIYPKSGLTTTFERLQFPEWLLTRPRELGSPCCTVLHAVHVSGWTECNHSSTAHFLLKENWEMGHWRGVSWEWHQRSASHVTEHRSNATYHPIWMRSTGTQMCVTSPWSGYE